MIYTVTADAERIDRIAKAIYGTERGGTVEALLAANPGLAALCPMIPRNTKITVPTRALPAASPEFRRPWE